MRGKGNPQNDGEPRVTADFLAEREIISDIWVDNKWASICTLAPDPANVRGELPLALREL